MNTYFKYLNQYKIWVSKGNNARIVFMSLMFFGFLLVFFSNLIPDNIFLLIVNVGAVLTVIMSPFIIETLKKAK